MLAFWSSFLTRSTKGLIFTRMFSITHSAVVVSLVKEVWHYSRSFSRPLQTHNSQLSLDKQHILWEVSKPPCIFYTGAIQTLVFAQCPLPHKAGFEFRPMLAYMNSFATNNVFFFGLRVDYSFKCRCKTAVFMDKLLSQVSKHGRLPYVRLFWYAFEKKLNHEKKTSKNPAQEKKTQPNFAPKLILLPVFLH